MAKRLAAGLIIMFVIACQPQPPQVKTTYQVYLPMFITPSMLKCVAGMTEEVQTYHALGIACGYEWGHTSRPLYEFAAMNSIRSKSDNEIIAYFDDTPCAGMTRATCLAAHARLYPGMTYLIFNEPDNGDLTYGDGLTPEQGAARFRLIADIVQSADPTARLVCCNVMLDWLTGWHDRFIAAYPEAQARITAWSAHVYAALGAACDGDECYTAQFDYQLRYYEAWAARMSKPLWITEFNGTPWAVDSATAARRLQGYCQSLRASPSVKAMFYFIGNRWSPTWSMSALNPDMQAAIVKC